MDPQELLFQDRRVIFTIRLVGFFVSELLAAISFLVYFGAIGTSNAVLWLCWPVGIGMTFIGLLQGFWNPYTKGRVLFYVYSYCFLGFFLSAFILGFSTAIFLGWLLLIMVMDIYFSRRVAAVGMASMSAAALTWLVLRLQDFSTASITNLVGNSLVVISIIFVISAIWRLTLESIDKLRQSRAEESLERQRLSSLVNNMMDGVMAVDEEIRVLQYNAAALNILDLNTSMEGKSLAEVFKPIDKNGRLLDVVHLVKNVTQAVIRTDLQLGYNDGSKINLYMAVAPVRLGYGQGGQRGYTIIMRDITREKSLEEERDEFISVVSHELRTPIAIAEGNISNAQFIATKTGDMDKVNQALTETHKQVMFLADMTNDLSTLSRAERGKLTVEIEAINVRELVNSLAADYRPEATEKGLEIKTDTEADLQFLNSSKLYVREILQNFVTNALKYTKKGSITIGARPTHNGVNFWVQDTGIGISRTDQEKVFDKFFRSEDFRTRESSGTGLGLYVTMKLARLLHAEVNLKSQLNEGSTFTIFIPSVKNKREFDH
jgi:PAS domain S-box-containing protein